MTALGFIETKGLLAAIEAADAMVKAADVRIIGKDRVGGGLVTITVAGEVSAVRASVDAAITAVQRIQGAELVSEHVIARPYDEVSQVIRATAAPPTSDETHQVVEMGSEPLEVQEKLVDTPELEVLPPGEDEPAQKTEMKRYTISELKKATVSKLRQLASGLSDISLSSQEIKTATKKKLIEAILKAMAS